MSKEVSTTSNVSLGFLEFLTLIFITLKLTGYIDWSWWWVLAPIWIQVGIFVAALLIMLLYYIFHKPTPAEELRRYSDELRRK